MIGFGFTTDVTITGMKMRLLKNFAYSAAVLYELIRLKKSKLKMSLNGIVEEINNVFVVVCNSRYAGGQFLMAPDADIADGQFEVLMVNNAGRFDLMQAFPKIFSGKHLSHPKVTYFKTPMITFEAGDKKRLAPDGEVIGQLPVTIEVAPKALEFFSV
jgi:diacylglycerol kinase family enzyme